MSKRVIKKPIKIAMSGYSGCGNTTTGKILATRLDIEHINYTFRSLAEDKGVSFEKLREMAQLDDNIDKELDARQLALTANKSCVLSSRLAIWLLDDADIKIFLDIPLEERSRRINKREGGDLAIKIAETEQRDRMDQERYQKIYGIDMKDFRFADIVINEAHLTAEEVVDRIMDALPLNYFV